MTRRRLPIGVQTFRTLRESDCYYVDKTAFVERLLHHGTHYATGPERFAHLIRTLHTRAGQRVAVLVDEYDKPILDALETPEVARANRDYLRGLYGVIKDSDAHVRFTFLTGISKFSKVNLFSQLNNLTDLTLDRRYSSICGYTEDDLDTVFAPELDGLDREQVREWYNGYRWRGEEKVYNCTTRTTCCCCSTAASSPRTGSRPVRPRSWWTRCSSGGSRRCRWTGR